MAGAIGRRRYALREEEKSNSKDRLCGSKNPVVDMSSLQGIPLKQMNSARLAASPGSPVPRTPSKDHPGRVSYRAGGTTARSQTTARSEQQPPPPPPPPPPEPSPPSDQPPPPPPPEPSPVKEDSSRLASNPFLVADRAAARGSVSSRRRTSSRPSSCTVSPEAAPPAPLALDAVAESPMPPPPPTPAPPTPLKEPSTLTKPSPEPSAAVAAAIGSTSPRADPEGSALAVSEQDAPLPPLDESAPCDTRGALVDESPPPPPPPEVALTPSRFNVAPPPTEAFNPLASPLHVMIGSPPAAAPPQMEAESPPPPPPPLEAADDTAVPLPPPESQPLPPSEVELPAPEPAPEPALEPEPAPVLPPIESSAAPAQSKRPLAEDSEAIATAAESTGAALTAKKPSVPPPPKGGGKKRRLLNPRVARADMEVFD